MSPSVLGLLGAALWKSLGRPVEPSSLLWADSLLGEGGGDWLYGELCRHGAVVGGVLDPRGLAAFLGGVAEDAELVWTLPGGEGSYEAAVLNLIRSARQKLWVVSPYLTQRGLGEVADEFEKALWRGVHMCLITHQADALGSAQSQALEALRREAKRVSGRLTVYTTQLEKGMIHAKVVVADDRAALVGSANLTAPGLGQNFEAGVRLGELQAKVVAAKLSQLCDGPWVVRLG